VGGVLGGGGGGGGGGVGGGGGGGGGGGLGGGGFCWASKTLLACRQELKGLRDQESGCSARPLG